MGEEDGITDLRKSHHRAEHRVHRRVSDVHHGVIAAGKQSKLNMTIVNALNILLSKHFSYIMTAITSSYKM